MKHALLFILLIAASPSALAAQGNIDNYVEAHIGMLRAQVDQLRASVSLLGREDLSDQDKFDRIGKPSFEAVESALAEFGFTVKQFYRFAADNDAAIEQWLSEHSGHVSQIQVLEAERENLMHHYDRLINQ